MYKVSDVRLLGIHTAKPLVPKPSTFEAEIATAQLKSINGQIVFKFWQK
jgi:hypothetical protein